jgi:hypothetical protein
MEAELHPLELVEHVVLDVQGPVGADVALDAAQDAERREILVHGRDLLPLSPQLVGGQPRDDPHVRRVVADGQVLVAERASGESHAPHGFATVGPGRVAVEVALDVDLAEEAGWRRRARELAQLRRAERDAESVVHARLVTDVWQRPQ